MERKETQASWHVICFWFWGQNGERDINITNSPAEVSLDHEGAVVKWRLGNLFTLLDAVSCTHLSVDVRYGELIKLCKQSFIQFTLAWYTEK